MSKEMSIDEVIEKSVTNHDRLVEESAALREMLDVICSRLNEDGVNTDNIGADLLRGQKLLSELGGGDDL